jgi:hypothetical protein
MSNTDFFKNVNVEMLWDVIIDEEIFKNKQPEIQNEIRNTFLNNIQGFYKMEQPNSSSLIELNKKYILIILNYIKKTFSPQKPQQFSPQQFSPQQIPRKIKISDEFIKDTKELITYEDIQNDRTSQFERDLNKYKDEFNDAMSLPIPPVPNFSDNEKDLPIGEMEKLIKEITDKRNYDVELINRNISGNNADNWLKPQETSIKSEKFQQLSPQPINKLLSDNKIQIIDLNTSPKPDAIKKNVTWGENESVELTQNYTNFNTDSDLFKKLKKIGPTELEATKISINTKEEISILKEDVKKINNKLEELDNNIKTILDILKNKN